MIVTKDKSKFVIVVLSYTATTTCYMQCRVYPGGTDFNKFMISSACQCYHKSGIVSDKGV